MSLTSSVKNWYETLSQRTIEHLFSNGENRVLELMKSITNDEISFILRLSKAVTGLRMKDWKNETIDEFLKNLVIIKETVEKYDKEKSVSDAGSTDLYRIVFTDADGVEITKSFNKTNYSSKAKLLLNDITTSLEEMGEAISEQEKRQVLMELLEKLC